MKKIYICNQSKQKLGGGFTFLDNFRKGCKGKAQLVNSWQESEIVLIAGCTQAERAIVKEAKEGGKKIVFRIDNMPKNSRNRNTSVSRMRDFSILADQIIFQSLWSRRYVGDWLEFRHKVSMRGTKVIYNGVDPEFFYYKDNPNDRGETYLFATYNTDENKRFPEAAYDFHLRNLAALKEGKSQPHLTLVGNIPGSAEYNFDFFNDEKITYHPPIEDRKQLGDIFRKNKYFYFPAFADSSPNVLSEALACGNIPLLINPIGGSIEIVNNFNNNKKISTIYDMADQYLELM